MKSNYGNEVHYVSFIQTVSESLDFIYTHKSEEIMRLIKMEGGELVEIVACMERLEVCRPTEFWLEIMTRRDYWLDISMYWRMY